MNVMVEAMARISDTFLSLAFPMGLV